MIMGGSPDLDGLRGYIYSAAPSRDNTGPIEIACDSLAKDATGIPAAAVAMAAP